MASFIIWRDVQTDVDPNNVTEWSYDTVTGLVTSNSFTAPPDFYSPFTPPAGTLFFTECDGDTFKRYLGTGNSSSVTVEEIPGYVPCCTITLIGFSIVKTNNTSLVTPDGTITISHADIINYEVSIDGGTTWVDESGGVILFEDLPAATYDVLIREIGTVCTVSTQVVIINYLVLPPLQIEELSVPNEYSAVFQPIQYVYKITNNGISIKQDLSGTYLESASADGRDFFASKPIFKIFDNVDYGGTWQITAVDDPDLPTKFYFGATYTTDQDAIFVPFGRQTFQLFAETSLSVFTKIADIAVSENAQGNYTVRLEGFLQSVYMVNPPVNNGEDLYLSRKYYVVPSEFEMLAAPTIRTSLYSTIADLSQYLEPLTPLGSAPINFINEQTQTGFPTIFSYIDTDLGRVVNITSSQQTEIITNEELVYIPALPLNTYTLEWISPDAIVNLAADPALPAWITVLPSPTDRVRLLIHTYDTTGGDYAPVDYDSTDYLTEGINAIVGCYEFEFSDDGGELFTLSICVYPVQQVDEICSGNGSNAPLNIAWINRQGGWSSYVFNDSRTFGKDIGTVKDFKRGNELKKASVEDVYDTVEVAYVLKGVRELKFIAELRQSVQAYLYNELTQQWDIPIYIDRESFPVYTVPFRAANQAGSFTFKYSREVMIQRQ